MDSKTKRALPNMMPWFAVALIAGSWWLLPLLASGASPFAIAWTAFCIGGIGGTMLQRRGDAAMVEVMHQDAATEAAQAMAALDEITDQGRAASARVDGIIAESPEAFAFMKK